MSLSEANDHNPPQRLPGRVLAWSEIQLSKTEAGKPGIALWRPLCTTVAIGISQSSEYDINPEAVRSDAIGLVRRQSGGGAVLLYQGVLCWEAWADEQDIKILSGGESGIRQSYAVLSMPIVQGLQTLGVEAFQAGICDISVNANGTLRKLAGTAQLRRRGKALVHGTLLVEADLTLLGRYLPQPTVAPDYREGRPHASFCINAADLLPDRATSMAAVAEAIAQQASTHKWNLVTPPEVLDADVEKMAQEKYLAPGWNWEKIRPGG